MGKYQRDKGKRYEREVAALFREHGFDCKRTAQVCGRTGEAADVIGAPGLHLECKRQETMRLYDWMDQAKRDSAGNGKLPVVIHRKSNAETLVTMTFDDWIKIYSEYANGMK